MKIIAPLCVLAVLVALAFAQYGNSITTIIQWCQMTVVVEQAASLIWLITFPQFLLALAITESLYTFRSENNEDTAEKLRNFRKMTSRITLLLFALFVLESIFLLTGSFIIRAVIPPPIGWMGC